MLETARQHPQQIGKVFAGRNGIIGALTDYECMSDEYSSSLHRASAEYRDFDLPPPDTNRWVTRRKAVIVNAVRTGVISLQEVCRRYELSVEEFLAWQRAIDAHGVPGLRVTRLQIYRDNPPSGVAKPRC